MRSIVLTLLLAFAAYYGWSHRADWGFVSGRDPRATQIRRLAAGVKASDVMMYTTTECPHCRIAKAWLSENGFAYTECNMSVEAACEANFRAYGADGTPFLVIRRGGKEHLMKNGFGSGEFLALFKP
jgi:glutaredoxin